MEVFGTWRSLVEQTRSLYGLRLIEMRSFGIAGGLVEPPLQRLS